MSNTITDYIHVHPRIHMHIHSLILSLNFAEEQVPSVSNLLNKLIQNCQVGYFSPPFSESKLLGWENELYRKLSFYIQLRKKISVFLIELKF